MSHPDVQIGLDTKGSLKAREIQLLVNIIDPDPELQPFYLADEASLFEVRDQDKEIIERRLEGYFGKPLRFEVRHGQPLWELVDQIKELYPEWPDGWP